ncbi:hypothetical protein Klosneuvirus_1_126 [Klosneuvirus KNV1]|uniref:Uncharacterized protein n=1 Tax=Klosneuvirus KNV1 TaxID=1977640 RepID=A0A1V0SHR5_9VIRU|nr:hypothetical protein Klosneuvirus_1_126 [Klosneuvirus KNV1]
MNSKIDEIVNDFNNMLSSLILNIATVCPKSIVGTNIKDIEKHIKSPKNKVKFVDLFCVKVLQYKNEIDNGDENFFMTKDYKDDLKDSEGNLLDQVVSMKSIWKDLSKENREIVISYMQMLCELSLQYYMIVRKS